MTVLYRGRIFPLAGFGESPYIPVTGGETL